MEVTIHKEQNMWTARVGNTQVFPLVPASENLFRLVTAIHNIYPDCKVWLDPGITSNPFLGPLLATMRRYRLTPFYNEVQEVLDNSLEKVCSLCGSRACYNMDRRVWVCLSPICGAHESVIIPGHFFKLSRWARRR